MAASANVPLTRASHQKFIAYYRSLQAMQNVSRLDLRSKMEKVDKAYQREQDQTAEQAKAKAANSAGDSSRFQNMTVPVVLPQVEAAVTHQTSVYLTGHPLFGVVASPEYMDTAMQLETAIEDQSLRGGWTRELIKFFRDGFKYDLAAIEVDWGREVTYEVGTSEAKISQAESKRTIWEGNTVKHLDMYNTFCDTRVDPCEVYKTGEFAGYTEYKSRIAMKAYIAELPRTIIANIKPALESGAGSNANDKDASSYEYYKPTINTSTAGDEDSSTAGTNWLSWAELGGLKDNTIQYKDAYQLTTLYCKILPSEFDLKVPSSNTPQIYKLVIVNHAHIIYCELQTNAHNYLPILFGQPLEDGLGYQTKSLAENAAPFQDLTSSYMNSIIASRRRAISDRVLYDPSLVASAHINSANPSAKIPVRPSAYGKDISKAVYQFPYREDQAAASMQQINALLGLSNTLAGQNQAEQGQFVKGNKTLHEYESVMQRSAGRDQLASILLEAQVFRPLKHILKLNILQFQGGTSLYNKDADKVIEIDPIALRKAVLDFKVSDGLVPSSKILNSDSFATALQVIGSSPAISGGYNVAPLFSYIMKQQGADLKAFEKSPEQLAFEQAMQQWQQIAIEALTAGAEQGNIPPQPIPQDYGYDPAANNPAPAEAAPQSGSLSDRTNQPPTGT